MYRLRLMCMDDGLHKEGDIIDGMDMMKAYRNTMKIYKKDCMNTNAGNDTGMNSIYIYMSLWKG